MSITIEWKIPMKELEKRNTREVLSKYLRREYNRYLVAEKTYGRR